MVTKRLVLELLINEKGKKYLRCLQQTHVGRSFGEESYGMHGSRFSTSDGFCLYSSPDFGRMVGLRDTYHLVVLPTMKESYVEVMNEDYLTRVKEAVAEYNSNNCTRRYRVLT